MKKFMKILCAIMAIICVSASLASCVSASKKAEIAETIKNAEEADITDVYKYINALDTDSFKKSNEETNYVMIEVNGYGKIVLALRPDTAPISVENFKKLVSEKFYDGLIFHRVIKDFMIQGGGYKSNFNPKNSSEIKGEFDANGVKNNLLHARGVLSMARTNEYDTASSQFFIVHKDSPHLDGQYAAFGYVIAGLGTVDKIAAVQTNSSDYPINKVVIKSVYFVSPIVD